jgi:hypothetical protein
MAGIIPTWAQQIHASFTGGAKTATLDCKSAATVNVTFTGNYVASVDGGALIIDPSTGKEVPILVTAATSFQVKASFGGGRIYVADPGNSQILDFVDVAVTDLNTLVGSITGSNCLASNGSAQLSIPVDSRAVGVQYNWAVVQGGENTQIDPATRNSPTVTINSLNAGTSVIRVTVTNDCSGEFCSSPTRSFMIRKTLSATERAAIEINGADCTSDDVLGDDNLIVLAVPPVLGRWDPGQYQWDFPANKLRQEFRSGDGSAIAFKVLDNSTDITVSLTLGPACNPGLVYTRVLRAPAPAAQIGTASNGYTASNTFCLPENNTTTETFRILNNPSSDFQYEWIIPAAWEIVSTNGPDNSEVVIRLANSSPGTITVRATNDGCGDELATIDINRYPSTAPLLVGPACISSGNIAPVQFNVAGGDNTYNWNVQVKAANGTLTPANWVPENPSNVHGATIRYIPNFASIANGSRFLITAQIVGNCGTGIPVTSTLEVPIGPAAPTQITSTFGGVTTPLAGSSCFTSGQQYNLASNIVDFAVGYTWSISTPTNGWTFITSQNSRQVTVAAGTGPVTISVVATASGCATSQALSFTANINPPKPGPITLVSAGSDCISPTTAAAVNFAVPAITGATFEWVLPSNHAGRYQILSGQGTNQVRIQIAAAATPTTPLPTPLTVKITSATGCVNTSDGFTMAYGNAPNLTNVVRAGDACVSRFVNAPSSSNYTYQWYLSDILVPGNTNFYFDSDPCSLRQALKLIVTDRTNGCSSQKVFAGDAGCSGCLTTRQASPTAETAESKSVSISPNPVSDQLNIELGEGTMNQLILVDISGKEVVRKKASGSNYILNVQGITPGVYHLIIQGTPRSIHQKIIIQ